MATIFDNEAGFRVTIWPEDHDPPHVHLTGHGGYVRIRIEGPTIYGAAQDLTRSDVRKGLEVVEMHGGWLAQKWKELHKKGIRDG